MIGMVENTQNNASPDPPADGMEKSAVLSCPSRNLASPPGPLYRCRLPLHAVSPAGTKPDFRPVPAPENPSVPEEKNHPPCAITGRI